MNDTDLRNDLGLEEAPPMTKKAAPKKKVLDPEDDRANWPTISISSEDGKPNYETVIVYGTKQDGTPFGHDLQIMRDTPVKVPPSVVNALKEAVSAHFHPKRGEDGRQKLVRQDRPSIPWQLIDKGKYIK